MCVLLPPLHIWFSNKVENDRPHSLLPAWFFCLTSVMLNLRLSDMCSKYWLLYDCAESDAWRIWTTYSVCLMFCCRLSRDVSTDTSFGSTYLLVGRLWKCLYRQTVRLIPTLFILLNGNDNLVSLNKDTQGYSCIFVFLA